MIRHIRAFLALLSRHGLIVGTAATIMVAALGVTAIALPPGYVTGIDFNHTIRFSPTSGPPSENNAWEVYPHFSGPSSYAPSASMDRNGNLTVQSCVGCTSTSQCVAPTACVSGYNSSGAPNCIACGSGGATAAGLADSVGTLSDSVGSLGG